ncbi:MAG: hypothetical protein WCA49_10340 [Candidatus Sulfotelmatobacter sp.]
MNRLQDPLFVEEEVPIPDQAAHRCGVKSVTGFTSAIVNEVASPNRFKSCLLTYDKQGNKTLHQQFDRDGKLIHEWFYDGEGKLVQEIAYEGSGKVDWRFDVAYDNRGWKEKRMYSAPDRLHYTIVADRDAGGTLWRATYSNPTGETIRSDSYLYDSRGLLERVDMGHMGERLYEYDSHERLQRKTVNLPGASAYGEVYEFEYDDRDLLTHITRLHFSATLLDFTFF